MNRSNVVGILVVVVAAAAMSAHSYSVQQAAASQKTAVQCAPADGPNAPMTRAQGAEILTQLSVIRGLLQREALAPAAMRRPAPIHDAALREGIGWHAIGSAAAPVTMIEFTDLQCPFCRRFDTTTFAELKKEYVDTGKVRFVSLDLPLPMHQYALDAAEAEECAGQQGKFWQFRDAVLGDQAPPTPDVLQRHASQFGLRPGEFQKCLAGKAGNAEVQAGEAAATAAGVRGTPGFIVGRSEGGVVRGVAFTGARPLAFFQQEIQSALDGSPGTPANGQRQAGRE